MTGQRQSVSLEVARAVLWHFGDTNLGIEPGGFWTAQIIAITRADDENIRALFGAFPHYVTAVLAVRDAPWGLDWLRGIVKADLDRRERGLDFSAVQS